MGSEHVAGWVTYLPVLALPPAIALGVAWEWAWKKHAETVEKQENCYHDWVDMRMKRHYGGDPYRECRLCGKQDHTPQPRD